MRYAETPEAAVGLGLALLGVLAMISAPASAAATPAPVSPGGVAASTVVEARCLTFSWAGVPGAPGYQLALFRTSAAGRAGDEGQPELIARVALPADSRSYTPPMGRCLERGESYAWSVAVASRDQPLDWSPAYLFEVADAPELGEVGSVEQAVAVLERYLAGRGGASAEPSVELPGPDGRFLGGSAANGALLGQRKRSGTGRDVQARAGQRFVGAAGGAEAETIVRTTAAASPSLGNASLSVASQVHLAASSAG